MAEIFEGDSWKHAKEPAPVVISLKRRTRAEAQAYIDDQYRDGRITLDEWRIQTDFLSEPDLK